MDSNQIKALLDSCFVAKTITQEMKQLPAGFKPRHIHILDAIARLGADGEAVRVSDVSRQLNITTPSVTKLLNELEEKGAVQKDICPADKRVTLVALTALGKEYEEKYVTRYHAQWAANMGEVSEAEVQTVVRTLNKLAKAMPKGENE
ncbi:MAG: MarR family transcriptional regulator [Gemmiger sp.]|nr:MarR family transcriptional regulator [Gemmiger sp.]